ncbi:hypothetical protein [Flavobacterium gilvum]|uniref:Uncharacterized protein n=1 Tax=Flavobacterium gilvum TaxID=1492737 RepID=A0AAC9N610_9FLAO|nr:hypothetical protein [Flavobacterium gilvum]AOW10586.1 hypothetical protein EM308_14405 [Flavobacterium gilvum]KFC58436.1 hypothetical protein FEM08_27850 [Flavobacterium gilvum]
MMKNFFTVLIAFGLFTACSDDRGSGAQQETVSPKIVSFDTDQNSTLMFQDNEPVAVMTSEARTYSIAQVIRVKTVDEKTIEVSNFAPFDIENATILATIDGKLQVQLFKIKKIRAHATQTMKYPFVEGTDLFLDTDNKKVDLSQYKTTGVDPTKISFDFTGDNEIILRLKKLQALKWIINYHDYDPNNNTTDNWEPINAKDIRRFSGLMINMGIVFVSDKFKQAFLNETIIGNDGTTVLTMAEKEKVYSDILSHPRFNCGKVTNVSGLGGGAVLGYAEHILHDYIKIDAGDLMAHEVGHCVGFNHNSNMTYPKTINNVSTGISPVMSRINKEFFSGGLFIVTLQNYYKPADFQ